MMRECPCSTKIREGLENPSPPPSRFPLAIGFAPRDPRYDNSDFQSHPCGAAGAAVGGRAGQVRGGSLLFTLSLKTFPTISSHFLPISTSPDLVMESILQDLKLRVLTLNVQEPFHSPDLVEARKKVKVNFNYQISSDNSKIVQCFIWVCLRC